jgi:hypothetical protein
MSERVFAISSVYENAELVPHLLTHYSLLGVHRMLLVVRTPERNGLFSETARCAKDHSAAVYWVAASRFADSDKADVEQSVLRENGVGPDDYVMHLDADEFQEYPAPLTEVVELMNRNNDWALRGWIVDRVADGGILAPLRPTPSIGEQFPIGCDLSEKLLRAWTQKIVLCRGRVRLQGGVRHDTCNAHYDRVPVGRSTDYRVHHFKWTDGLVERMKRRLQAAAIGAAYRQECHRFIEYFRAKGKIDLSDKTLRSRHLGALAYR